MEPVKITRFELENVKRVSLVRIAPTKSGLTVIGGKNAQGKTSILDGICYALGGEKYRPGNLQKEGTLTDAHIYIELSNGLIVERKGKNASLKVTDSTGAKAGQKLLDSFIDELALNLPKFIAMRDEEKAMLLLQTLGIEQTLTDIDTREKVAFDKRHDYGVIADQKRKHANEMIEYPNMPDSVISAEDVAVEYQEKIARNAKRDLQRKDNQRIQTDYEREVTELERLKKAVAEQEERVRNSEKNAIEARNAVIEENENVDDLKNKLVEIDEINGKIRANFEKQHALDIASEAESELATLTDELEKIREERRNLLDNAKMPLENLTVERNDKNKIELRYNAQKWDCMSNMEQYRVGVAIVHALRPECGFVLLDKLEAFDTEQLTAFGEWLVEMNLQAISTRVGTSDCSIVIEDGYAVEDDVEPAPSNADKEIEEEKTQLEEW